MDYNSLAEEFISLLQSLGKVHAEKQVAGMMGGSMFIIQVMFEQGDNVTPGEISNKLNISTARVATSLNMLEEKGFIVRKNDPKDRRKTKVFLTDKGRKFSEDHKKHMNSRFVNLFEQLGEEDSVEYVRISKKISELIFIGNIDGEEKFND